MRQGQARTLPARARRRKIHIFRSGFRAETGFGGAVGQLPESAAATTGRGGDVSQAYREPI
jgi:hypothetical protein